jgi:hypothetical protein
MLDVGNRDATTTTTRRRKDDGAPDSMNGLRPGWSAQNLKFDSVKSVMTYTIFESGKSQIPWGRGGGRRGVRWRRRERRSGRRW